MDKLTETDARGNTTSLSYDANGNLTKKVDPLNGTTTMTYGAFSRLMTQRLPDGESTTNAYDGSGNLLTSKDSLSNTTTYSYTANGQLATVLQPGNTTASSFVHNADGTIQSMTDPTGASTSFGYDGAGHLTALTDPLGHKRTMVVDARGQVNSMTDANQNTTSFGYDAQGNRTSLTDPTGAKTAFGYDSQSRLTSTTDAQGHVATTSYDGNGNVLARTDADGHTSAYAYDLANRLIQSTDPTGAVTAMGFCADIGSTPCQTVDPNGLVTTRVYDPDQRPTSVTDGAGDVTTTGYTPGGKVASSIDPRGQSTAYAYDPDGRPSSVTPPGSIGAVFYTYDARGNRSQVQDANGHLTKFSYDANNRLLTETNPLNQVTTYTYNPDGTRATKLDANGHLASYGYDTNKRLTSVTFADATSYQFAYDTRGHRTLEQSPAENRSMVYDSLGRLSTATDAQLNKTLTYGYDAAGNRTSLSYDGLTTSYVYDADNRLTQLVDPDGESSYLTYDPGSRRTGLVQGNGVATAYSYDAANRTTAIAPTAPLSAAMTSVLPSFAYTYDADGNPLTKAFANNTQESYVYDAADRLTQATHADSSYATYSMDGVGNRTLFEDHSGAAALTAEQSLSPNAFNQVVTVSGSDTGQSGTYTYGNDGNRLSQVIQPPGSPAPPKQTTTYTWNDDDRLASAALPNGQTDSFLYDANGIRVGKSDSTGSVRYLIDPLTKAILATYDAGTFLRLFTYNQNPQKLDEVFSYKTAQATKYYPHTDMLGSVYAVSDSTGTSQATWTYDVYGTRTQTSGTLVYAFGFTGREHDGDTGLIYSRARYYDPSVGSWINKDPGGYQSGPNLYQYCNDRPTILVDLKGLDPTTAQIIVNGIALAIIVAVILAVAWDVIVAALLVTIPLALLVPPVAEEAEEEAPVVMEWSLGAYKTLTTWANQMTSRGWTFESITETLNAGQACSAPNNFTTGVNVGNAFLQYTNPVTGLSLVLDTVTNEIIQLGGPDFLY